MKSLFSKLFKNEFSRGGIILTGGSLIANFLNYFFNTLSARALGPASYSELATLFSYTYITAVPISVLSTLLIQKISSVENRLIKALEIEAFFFKSIKTLLPVILLTLFLIPFLPAITNLTKTSSYFLIPFMILSLITAFYSATLQGLRFFSSLATIAILSTIIKLFGAVLVFFQIDGLGTVISFLALSTIYTWFASRNRIHQNVLSKPVPINSKERHFLNMLTDRQFILTTISLLAITLLNNADVIYVKKFVDPTNAGLYSAWSLMARIILFVATPALSVAFIFFSSPTSKENQRLAIKTSLFGLSAIIVVSSLIYKYFASLLIAVFFGESYRSIAPFLSQAAIFGSLYTTIFFLNNYFLAKKSSIALLLPLTIPFYLVSLFATRGKIESIFWLNIIFSAVVTVLYLSSYILTARVTNTKTMNR